MMTTSDWFELRGSRVLRDWSLDTAVEDVLRMQAANPDEIMRRNPALVRAAEKACEQGAPLLQPQVVFRVIQVNSLRHERLTLEEGFGLEGKLLLDHLKSASYVVFAVCTVGAGVENLAKAQFKQDPIFSLALEGFGSAIVERLVTEFCTIVDRKARDLGFSSSIPLSPGMIGWSVDVGQKQIFDTLETNRIGVELTESSMMLPVKTISLLLGVGTEMDADGSTCDYCNMRERCHYRDHYLTVENR